MDLASELTQELVSLFWIALASVLAAVLASVTRRKVPDVVWLLGMGMVLGPYGLHLVSDDAGVSLIKNLGLGFLFLMAGFHIARGSLGGSKGRWGISLWLLSAAVAFGVMLWVLPYSSQETTTSIVYAIALTSTALGTLLPILKDSGEVDKPIGRAVILNGAVGELSPIVAMSLLLSSRSTAASALVLILFVLVGLALVLLPGRVLAKRDDARMVIIDGSNSTASTTLRMIFLVLVSLLALSAILQLDIVLGAFAAGIIVRRLVPAVLVEETEEKLTDIGYSFLVPTFFVCSGMVIDWRVILQRPLMILLIVFLILTLRGGPIFLAELTGRTGSGLETVRDKMRLGLLAGTGLPIIVAVTGIAVGNGLMSNQMASILVLAGAVTVLAFPTAARLLSGGRTLSLGESVQQAEAQNAANRRAKKLAEAELDHSEEMIDETLGALRVAAEQIRRESDPKKLLQAEDTARYIEQVMEDAERSLRERQSQMLPVNDDLQGGRGA